MLSIMGVEGKGDERSGREAEEGESERRGLERVACCVKRGGLAAVQKARETHHGEGTRASSTSCVRNDD